MKTLNVVELVYLGLGYGPAVCQCLNGHVYLAVEVAADGNIEWAGRKLALRLGLPSDPTDLRVGVGKLCGYHPNATGIEELVEVVVRQDDDDLPPLPEGYFWGTAEDGCSDMRLDAIAIHRDR